MTMNKNEILSLLTNRQIPFMKIEHEAVWNCNHLPNFPDGLSSYVAKNLLLANASMSQFFLCAIPSSARIDTKKVREAAGSGRLHFASEKEIDTVLGVQPGVVSPLNLLNAKKQGAVLLMDMKFQNQSIGIHPNNNTVTIWLKAKDLADLLADYGNKVLWADLTQKSELEPFSLYKED